MIRFYFILFIVAGSVGKYVTANKAREECGENATWNDCASPCNQRSCNDRKPSREPKFCPTVCLKQCTCNPGYVEGPDENCILEKDCPTRTNCTGLHEFWNECGSDCEKQCEEPKEPISCPAVCVSKCSCTKGHVRGPDRNCVAKQDCPPKNTCTGPHEFWNECGSDCEKECEEPKEPIFCPAVCVPKCSCTKGHVRGPDGNCVAKQDCPPKNTCTGPHEFWNECGSDCEKQCEEPKEPISCPAVCVPKCSCTKGHVRGPDGNCVAKQDCPPKNTCTGPHEFWNECGSDCEKECEEPKEPIFCPAVCVPKCSCTKGHVRGPDGYCVAKQDCPPKNTCTGPHEFWNECGSDCEKQCEEPKEPISCPAVCVPKCSCTKGHVRGPDGNCVAKQDCPLKNTCTGPHEFWNECGSDCEKECEEPEEPISCLAVCVPKCSCTEGHIRGPDGNCILKKDCPPTNECSDPNEVWTNCGTVESCEKGCKKPEPGRACPAICISKCECKPGLVRGPHGKCIKKEDCPNKCPGRNQFWNECGSGCEPRCDKSHLHRVCPAVCVEKCSCKHGYMIANNGDCVREEDCDSTCAYH